MIENAEPAEAVKLYAAGSEQDRKDSATAIRERIVNSTKLEPDEKRALLDKVGVSAPPTLEFDAELSKLRKAKAAMEKATWTSASPDSTSLACAAQLHTVIIGQ